MKAFATSHSIPSRAAHLLAALFLCVLVSPAPAAMPGAGTNEDFSAVSRSVVELLQSRDTARFAAELAPAVEDWQSILSTNVTGQNPDPFISRLARSSVQAGHPEMVGVPVHTQLDLLDTGLRFGVWERSCFHRMVEYVFHIQELSPVATSDSTHAFFLR
jgi:hypothetical protein